MGRIEQTRLDECLTLPDRGLPVPFLKWAGGKGQLLAQLERFLPSKFASYFEPFLGGGAVFFHLLPNRATLSDSNPELIQTFKSVRDEPEALMQTLDKHLRRPVTASYFYRVRRVNPADLSPVERAARTLFLNKTCFNGLYRVNAKGEFNVPFGRYKNPRLYSRENLLAASKVLQGTRILVADYQTVCERVRVGDFVYFDPPYHPLSETSAFTSYTKEEFGDREQRQLSDIFRGLDKRGAKLMLSNSSTSLVQSLYSGFRVETLKAKRAINSKGSGRGAIDELLIMNYP